MIYARRPCSAQYYPNLMSLGTIAARRACGDAPAPLLSRTRARALAPASSPRGMLGSYATTERFAHWPIIPRGASRIGQSSHGGRLICANQVWIVLIMHSLICSSACSIPPSVEGSTSGTSRGAPPLGMSPRLIPPHSVVYPHTSLASLKYCYIA